MENQTQTPVPVQVVPSAPAPSVEDRFLAKLERMGTLPTMTEGDRERRPLQQAPQQAPQQPQLQEQPVQDAAQEPAEETYEFEFSGGKYQVPKELKELHDGYLRQQDYTQKQQEIAELRRSAEAALQQSKQQQELQTALAPHVSRLNSINEQLTQYTQADWNKLFQSDPAAAQQHSVTFSVLNNQKQLLERQIQQTAQQHMQKITEAQNQMLEAADKAMSLKVKGWTRDTGKQLNDFARKAYGFTEQEVATTLDPRALEMMHDAKQWRDLQASKSSKVVIPEKTLKPAASQPGSQQEGQQALKRALRVARTDGQRDRAAQALLESRMR